MNPRKAVASPVFSPCACLAAVWLGLLVLAAGPVAGQTNALTATPEFPFRDPDRPWAERVADLVGRLSLAEKIELIGVDPPAIPRLEIASHSWWGEAIHGVSRAGRATMFPQVIGQAATWDPDLIRRMASVIGDEARAKHRENPEGRYRGLNFWAPCADLVCDPRWGRAQETYGEDPCLAGRMVVAFIQGMQGDDPHYLKTAVCVKHFALHSQETDRTRRSFWISEPTLRDYYFPTFRQAVVEGRVSGCMAAHNGLNGVPCHANGWLFNDVLRGDWSFPGAVFTDWCATRYLVDHYHYSPTYEAAVRDALQAGMDVLSESKSIFTNVLTAVTNGLVSVPELDEAVSRALTIRFRLGEFDPPGRVPYSAIPVSILGRPEHVALARAVGRESLVLLKNGPVADRPAAGPLLPLDRRRLESVAVLGPYASRIYFGSYTSDPAAPPVSLVEGIRAQLGEHVLVRTAPWYDGNEQDRRRREKKPRLNREACWQAALRAAADADVVVLGMGLWMKHEFEGKDRVNLNLPEDQEEFVEKILEVNPAAAVVLFNGTPLTVGWIADHVPAVVEAWLPGEQGGNAVADVLFGDVNPAGRLPMTFYSSVASLPPLEDHELIGGRTYMYLRDPPLWPFGHGLSYTRFEYRNLRIDPPRTGTNGVVRVSFDVTNAGGRDGDEVAQLYVRDAVPSEAAPRRRLRAFRRVQVPRGATVAVALEVSVSDLGTWDEQLHARVVAPGEFAIEVGASSADLRLCGHFTVE